MYPDELLDPGRILFNLKRCVEDALAQHVLSNAMLHCKGWWTPEYDRCTDLPKFFEEK